MTTPHKEVFYVRYGVTSEMGLHRFLLPLCHTFSGVFANTISKQNPKIVRIKLLQSPERHAIITAYNICFLCVESWWLLE